MSMYKYPLSQNVLDAAQQRIKWTLDNLSQVCVSFSGGKDSTIMFHLTAQLARAMNKKTACCLSTGRPNSPAPSSMWKRCARCIRT